MKQNTVPGHVGIIPDGMRRYARKVGISYAKAYSRGIERIEDVMQWAKESGVKMLTAWGFSSENFGRDSHFKSMLFKLFEMKFRSIPDDSRIHDDKVRIRVIGNVKEFPPSLREAIRIAEESTAGYSKFHANIALSHGGRAEIVEACNAILNDALAGKIRNVTEDTFSRYTHSCGIPNPDLIIRTSEQRTSGFLMWKSPYSELVFLPGVLFPELKRDDFNRVIAEYGKRDRRFGK